MIIILFLRSLYQERDAVLSRLCLVSSVFLQSTSCRTSTVQKTFLLITVNIFRSYFSSDLDQQLEKSAKKFPFFVLVVVMSNISLFFFLFISKFFQHSKPVQPPTHIYLSIEFVLLVIVSFAYRKLWKLGTRRCNNKINKFDKEHWLGLVCVVYEMIKINRGRTLS